VPGPGPRPAGGPGAGRWQTAASPRATSPAASRSRGHTTPRTSCRRISSGRTRFTVLEYYRLAANASACPMTPDALKLVSSRSTRQKFMQDCPANTMRFFQDILAIVRLVATDLPVARVRASLQVASESVSLSDWLPAVAARSSSYRDS
jgi:hypothetical protein